MCGIFGVIGAANPVKETIAGLEKLEYRGYDSAGIGIIEGGKIKTVKSVGNIAELKKKLPAALPPTTAATTPPSATASPCVGHTRWATHGGVTEQNSHPHLSADGRIAVVHNGIIENYTECVSFLTANKIKLQTAVDTEVIPNILCILFHNNNNILKLARGAMAMLRGDYAVCCVLADAPETLIAAKSGHMPLHIGIAPNANFVASDILAFPPECESYTTLQSGEIAILTKDGVQYFNAEKEVRHSPTPIPQNQNIITKNGFSTFMEKEIFDIPDVITRVTEFYRAPEMQLKIAFLRSALKHCRALHIVACGTSYHAGLIIAAMIERQIKIRCTVTVASEFTGDKIFTKKEAALVISQSGETADTISAVTVIKSHSVPVAALCNVPSSTIAQTADICFPMLCDTEIAVASTKAFVSSVLVGAILAGGLSGEKADSHTDFNKLPETARELIASTETILSSAPREFNKIFFIGSGLDYFIALESALKVKEVTYMHCEGFAAGELKHGTLSLVDEKTLAVAYFTGDEKIDARVNNAAAEIKTRGGNVVQIPPLPAVIKIIPAQLFALQLSARLGINPDQPRNLAKSVTVG